MSVRLDVPLSPADARLLAEELRAVEQKLGDEHVAYRKANPNAHHDGGYSHRLAVIYGVRLAAEEAAKG